MSFSSWLGGYPRISQGTIGKLGEESVEEEGSEDMELEAALEDTYEAPEAPNLCLSNQPPVSPYKQSLLKMMQKMSQSMNNLTQKVSPRDPLKAQYLKNTFIKAPYSFDGMQAHILRVFIQYFQLIFHNYHTKCISHKKKVFYSTSFLTG
ncbi:hypothetical protein O181_004512 [Austropuccinia psidii MF-1]|uniref:Uncharacterized protein n=1 Tax=Austropuccinia psidii MF-1 TaxID=1389203 RepID=A0A9Q3BGD9_9BASI|nr:hypothetical protein [Austropuccinia psidii MF-1]